jgi:hypothetical protein
VGIRTVKYLCGIIGGGLVMISYQNCSKINVKDPFVASAELGQQTNNGLPDVPAPPSDEGIVVTDPQGDIVTVQIEHPSEPAPSPPPPSMPNNPPTTSTSPSVPSPSTPPSPADDEDSDVCVKDKKSYDNAIDLAQFEGKEVRLNLSSKKRTLVYCSSGKGHVKEINTEDSEGEVVVCGADVDVLKGKKGKVKVKKGKVKDKKEYRGDCHDDDGHDGEDDDHHSDSSNHDNRDHDFGDNSNSDHDKEKISEQAAEKSHGKKKK